MCYVGFARGFNSSQANRYLQGEKARMIDAGRLEPDRPPPSLPPGMRAEGCGVMLPATMYTRPSNPSGDVVAMLDGTPIQRPPLSQTSSGTSKFHEHIAEMEDTSSRPGTSSTAEQRRPRTPNTDSPTLGRGSGLSGPSMAMADEVRRKQHMMSWSTYETSVLEQNANRGERVGATMTPKSPSAARNPDSPEKVSLDTSSLPKDSGFVMSPFGSIDRGMPYGK